jgi:uncharacterized protein YodC (DUF2158 family)
MANRFGTGETVQLKSGGPVMTVVGINAFSQNLVCKWFAGKTLKQSEFHPQMLKPAKPEEAPGTKKKLVKRSYLARGL